MECDFCDKKATVFLTQLVDGQMKKVCLCEECAAEKGVTDPTGFSLADLLLSGLPEGANSAPAAVATTRGKACPACGFTLDDLKRVRRFGCSECYTTFHEEVLSMLRGLHAGTGHSGKVPKGLMQDYERTQRLEQLRSRLDQAISAENYEEAAGLRDEIREIEVNVASS